MKKDLAYWKSALIDVRQARKRAVFEGQSIDFIRELSGAARFAQKRIREIELNTFKIGSIE